MSRRWRRIVASAVGLVVLAVVALVGWIAMPLPAGMTAPAAAPSVTLTDRHGVVLRTTRAADGSRARWMRLDEMDPRIITAFIAVEDRRFLERGGRGALGAIDWRALARALRDNLRAGRVVSGASTITMQTARLLRPSRRDWGGKVMQVLWALRLASRLGPQQMLEQYLNRVQLGQGAVGVSSAAALYFGASARSVSLGQAAMLAGIAHAPSSDNPLVSASRARAARSQALVRMRRAGFASAEDAARAEREPLATVGSTTPFLAPHFTTQVLQWEEPQGAADMARAGEWRTSLDIALQREIEAEVRRTVDDLRGEGAREAAAVVLDNYTGEILAWVGSPDFWEDDEGQADMVVSPRQPGSALKPFLYGLAFDRGYTPASILADIPHEYRTSAGPYRPRNYDRGYHGPVRAREALASSFNVPAVVLADAVGSANLLGTLRLAGFASLTRSADHYGLGLALGNGEVSLLELANAYRALAGGGVWRSSTWRAVGAVGAAEGRAGHVGVAGVTWDSTSRGSSTGRSRAGHVGVARVAGGAARSGRVGRTADGMSGGAERRVMSAQSAALVLDILSDASARVPGFGLETPLEFPFRAAAKTGTSRHFTDNWAVATTAGFTVAVWVGNFNGRPMEGVSGVSGAGPLLHRSVLLTAKRYDPGQLALPASVGARPVEICRLSGLRATSSCPHLTEWFAPGTEPTDTCTWHRGATVVLPREYAAWLEQRSRDSGVDIAAVVSGATPVASAESIAAAVLDSSEPRGNSGDGFRITSPLDGDRYHVPPGVDARFATIPLRSSGARARASVRWWVDGREWRRPRLPLAPGTHVIRARASTGDSAEVRIVVE